MSGQQVTRQNGAYDDIDCFLTLTPQIIPQNKAEPAYQEAVTPKKKREKHKNIPRNILSAIQTILKREEKQFFKFYRQNYQCKCDKLVIAHFYLFCIQKMKTKRQINEIGLILLQKILKMKNKLDPSNIRAKQKMEIQQRILEHLFLENHYGDGWKQMLDSFSWKTFQTLCEGLTQNTQKNQVLTSIKKLRTSQKLVKLVRARLLPNINRSIRVLTQNQENTPEH